MNLKNNMMTDIDLLLDRTNPKLLSKKISENLKKTRVRQKITQKELAERSGVPLSNLKRFEQKAEIALNSLLKLAIVLDSTAGFEKLFTEDKINTLDDFIATNKLTERKRVRKK